MKRIIALFQTALLSLVLFTWDYETVNNDNIKGFKLYVEPQGGLPVQVFDIPNPSAREFSADININSSSIAWVVAYSDWGESEESNVISIGGVPKAPKSLSAKPMN